MNKIKVLFVILFIVLPDTFFGQSGLINNRFIFYSEILDTTTSIQLEYIESSLDYDTLIITPSCKPDTFYYKHSITSVGCLRTILEKKGKTKIIIPFSIPFRYRHMNFVIIKTDKCKYYLKSKIKKRKSRRYKIKGKDFHLYKIEYLK